MRIFAEQLRSSLGSHRHQRRETLLLGSLTLALALTQTRMGNTPSVPGPDGGQLHVKRDDSDAGSDRVQRPQHSQIENTDTRLAEDYDEEEVNRRRNSLSVPESYDSYTTTTTTTSLLLMCLTSLSID